MFKQVYQDIIILHQYFILYGENIPIANNDENINNILNELSESNIIERTKRDNSQWTIDKGYTYVLLLIPTPSIFIGAKIQLPDYIKNSKGTIGFENMYHNICFCYCLAYYKNSPARKDRLYAKAKELYKKYYHRRPTKNYKGVENG